VLSLVADNLTGSSRQNS